MEKVILLNKPLGLTPLELVYQFKKQHPEYMNEKIGYAGRLDPMAEGLLLLLIGDENKKRKEYEALPKTYEFSMLIGVSTDTYDLMGSLTQSAERIADGGEYAYKIQQTLPTFLGELTLPYPPYSSRTVNGIPLYRYARENRLDDIQIPTKKVTISSFELLSSTSLPFSDLLSHISRIIPKVTGDFRQEEIVKKWHDSPLPKEFQKFHLRLTCTSGTYVRGIVHELGEKLGVPTVTYSIRRRWIGSFSLEDSITI